MSTEKIARIAAWATHRAMAMFVLLVIAAGANADPAGLITADPNNPSWLKYADGSPFYLAAPGDPEDFLYRGSRRADGTRSGDQESIITKLASTGANGIYMQIIRSHGGDGNSTHNPFVNNDPSQGLNEAVLSQWDAWFSSMDDNGIVIYLFFYDDSASIWSGNSVGSEERAFFTSIVNRFEKYGHLIWVIAEEYGERFEPERVSELAEIIRQTDDFDHPIAVHKNNGTDFEEFATDPNIEQFAMQYNVTSPEAIHDAVLDAWNAANGRYNINMSEATRWGTGTAARQKAWAAAMGGAYVMGLGMNVIDTPLSDLADLGKLRRFMESTDFSEMRPRDDLATQDTDWVLASSHKFILYGAGTVSELGLTQIESGIYRFEWFDPVSGDTSIQESVTVSGGGGTWPKPTSFGQEVALYISSDSTDPEATVPKPPTDLSAD